MTKKNDLAVMPTDEVAEKLQEVVLSVTGKEGLQGFQKAFLMASGIKQLKELLTNQYMAPIMELQGSKLGFRTDKDRNKDGTPGPGYPIEVVRDCVIEAVLNGLQVTGNQFNIIAGNCYPTKEGCGYRLNTYPGLKYQIICGLPRVNDQNTSAAIDVKIKWHLKGEGQNEETIPIPIRVNSMMGIDAIIGKATRKARAWLLSRITGTEVTDVDIEEAGAAKVVDSKINNANNKKDEAAAEHERLLLLIQDANSVEELEFYLSSITEKERPAFDKKRDELLNAKK